MPANDPRPRCPPCVSRGRNSKCNRQIPCSACIRKNTQAECIASAPPDELPRPPPRSPDRPRGTRLRIDRATPTNPSVYTGTNSTRLSSLPDEDDEDEIPLERAPPIPLIDRITGRAPPSQEPGPPIPPTPPVTTPQPTRGDKATRQQQRDELRARLLELESSDAEEPPAPTRGAEKPATLPPKPALPVIVPGKLAPGILVVTPQPIVKIVRDGLTSYISLANLTDAACIAFAEGRVRNASSTSRNSASASDNVPDYDELTLSSSTWNQGWKRYIALLEQFHPVRAIAWAAHHALIFHDPTFDIEFQTWLRYDIQVRVRAMNEDLDPAIFQEHIFRAIERNRASFTDR
ncbi:hypothetical protein FRC06_010546, partial [Ceratobasidium sp. 370]